MVFIGGALAALGSLVTGAIAASTSQEASQPSLAPTPTRLGGRAPIPLPTPAPISFENIPPPPIPQKIAGAGIPQAPAPRQEVLSPAAGNIPTAAPFDPATGGAINTAFPAQANQQTGAEDQGGGIFDFLQNNKEAIGGFGEGLQSSLALGDEQGPAPLQPLQIDPLQPGPRIPQPDFGSIGGQLLAASLDPRLRFANQGIAGALGG